MNMLIKNDSIKGVKAITPHNSNIIDQNYNHALMVEAAGKVECIFHDGTVCTFAFANNEILKVQAKVITAAGTTATGIKGLKLYD